MQTLYCWHYMDLVATKPVGVSDQVMLKPVSSATETSYVENLLEESLDMVCSKKWIKKVLISLRGCTGWSAPLLLANSEDRFSHVEAHIALDNMHFCLRKPVFGPIAQLVSSLTADPGVASLIPAWSHTFMEIDHEIIYSRSPSADSKRVVVWMCTKYWSTA